MNSPARLAAVDETLRLAYAYLAAAPAGVQGHWLRRAVVLVLAAREQLREIEGEDSCGARRADHGGDDD